MIENYIYPKQKELFNLLKSKYPNSIAVKDRYILVKGEAPVLLVAHMDTVHKKPVSVICYDEDKNVLMSPQGIGGDDRCGIYALNTVYENSEVKPWLLFTCDEEIGGIGANVFAQLYPENYKDAMDYIKFIIEIDRKGKNDAVYYDCWNEEFESWITAHGFVTQYGSFSDISLIAPAMGKAAVNLSSGYYNAHTEHEYIVMSEIEAVIEIVEQMVTESLNEEVPQFIYAEADLYGYDKYGLEDRYGLSKYTCQDIDDYGYYGFLSYETMLEVFKSYKKVYEEIINSGDFNNYHKLDELACLDELASAFLDVEEYLSKPIIEKYVDTFGIAAIHDLLWYCENFKGDCIEELEEELLFEIECAGEDYDEKGIPEYLSEIENEDTLLEDDGHGEKKQAV